MISIQFFANILVVHILSIAATVPIIAGEPDVSLKSVYKNMDIDIFYQDYTIHDPSRIITVGNKQLIAVTGKAQEDGYDCGIETWWRKDNGRWRPGQCLFQTKPYWVAEETPLNDGAFWAPELDLKDDGTLTLLYSVSEMAEQENEHTCVGIAYSVTKLNGFPNKLTWADAGEPLTCLNGVDYPYERSVIDPSVFWGFGDDEGKLFLVTGGGMITGTELEEDTYFQKDGVWFGPDNDHWTDLSSGPDSEDNNWVEAPYIHPEPMMGYYYLFTNWGGCCNGVDSTYEIRVGRSRNPLGPYLDKNGKDMMEGGGTLVAKTNDYVIGPGHTGIYTNRNQQYITFHYYDERREGNSWIAEKRLYWRNGWPFVTNKIYRDFPENKLV